MKKRLFCLLTLMIVSCLLISCTSQVSESSAEGERAGYPPASSYIQYLDFLETYCPPDDFLTYEDLSAFGTFVDFVCLSPPYTKRFDSSLYGFLDENGFRLDLYVDENKTLSEQEDQLREYGYTKVDLTGRDLRFYEDGRYYGIQNGLLYTYIKGNLSSIKWKQDAYFFTLCNVSSTLTLADYPMDKHRSLTYDLLSGIPVADRIAP